MKSKLLLFLFLSTSATFFSQTVTIDPTFTIGNGFGLSSLVSEIAIQTDNKILVSGVNLSSINGNAFSGNFVRLNTNGTLDATMSNIVSSVFTIAIQPDGKILAGGDAGFNFYRLKRFNADGTVDNSFSVGLNTADGFNNTVYKIALQPDSKILVQGAFTSFSTTTTKQITRLNNNGSIDINFNNNINSVAQIAQTNGVRSFKLLSDGKILVATNSSPKLIRLNSNGTLDNTFNCNETNPIDPIEIQNDEKILIGTTNSNNGELKRLNNDGSTDNSFTSYSVTGARIGTIKIFNDNKILIRIFNGGTTSPPGLIKLNNNGTIVSNFNIGTGFNNHLSTFTIQPDGKILAGGSFTSYNGTTKRGIVRLSENNLSSEETKLKKISIYPNPTKETLHLFNLDFPNTDYNIYDIQGKLIISGKVIDSKINVNSLEKGNYILKLKNNQEIINTKFIKD